MSKTKRIKKKGFIVIQHAILVGISDQECEDVLAQDYGNEDTSLHFEHLKIRPVLDHISHKNMNEINWRRAAALQEEIVEKQLKPMLQKFENYELVYFGAAPVPLAVHLGYLVEGWKQVIIYLKHHKEVENQKWYRNLKIKGSSDPEVSVNGTPKESYNTDDDMVISVQVSHKVKEDEINKSIKSKITKIVKIELEELKLDLDSVKKCSEIADKVEDVFKAIHDNLPKTNTTHLIGTIPVGLAFLIGKKIRTNTSCPIQTYQYDSTLEYPYTPVLTINQSYTNFTPLTDKEVKKARSIRKDFKKNSWQNLQSQITKIKKMADRNTEDSWLDLVLETSVAKGEMDTNYWKNLQRLDETALAGRTFNLNEDIEGYKYDDQKEEWAIGNNMIHELHKRLKDTAKVERALRIVLIHEGLHYYQHNLSEITVEGIGRFPKIIEDADYQADIYALLHEYDYSRMYAPSDIDENNLGAFFANMLDVALHALWSFNDPGITMKEIQIRRLNRFLIWYWQCIALSDSRVKSLEQVINILAVKPVFEIKGLHPKIEGERILCNLERFTDSNLELGIFIKNRIIRSGTVGNLRLPDLIRAFRERDHFSIKKYLEGFNKTVMNYLS